MGCFEIAAVYDNGCFGSCLFCCGPGRGRISDDDVDAEPYQFFTEREQRGLSSLRRSNDKLDTAALLIPEGAQTLPQSRQKGLGGGISQKQHPDTGGLALRSERRYRPYCGQTAKKYDELAPSHSRPR